MQCLVAASQSSRLLHRPKWHKPKQFHVRQLVLFYSTSFNKHVNKSKHLCLCFVSTAQWHKPSVSLLLGSSPLRPVFSFPWFRSEFPTTDTYRRVPTGLNNMGSILIVLNVTEAHQRTVLWQHTWAKLRVSCLLHEGSNNPLWSCVHALNIHRNLLFFHVFVSALQIIGFNWGSCLYLMSRLQLSILPTFRFVL